MMRYSSPSILISVPEYFPYSTRSPTFTVTGLSFSPSPTATTFPFWGFSFAVSGMIIPEAVFVSASAASTSTRASLGLKFGELFFSFKLRKASRQGQLRTLTGQVGALAQTRPEVALRERRPEWRGYEQYFRPDDFLFHNSSKSDELF